MRALLNNILDMNKHTSWKPLTPATWPDFEALFGPRGACGGCWCMCWRMKAKDYEASHGQGTKAKMKALVDGGTEPGILAYESGAPIGWCSVGPRTDFIRLENSRILAPVDNKPVWSITCLVVEKAHRRQGVSRFLVAAAAEFAKSKGAAILEAYPVIPKKDPMPDVFAWNGIYSTFKKLGFEIAAQRSDTHPVVRINL